MSAGPPIRKGARIGIDYTAAARQRAGIGRYTRNLVRSVVGLDPESEYVLFVAGQRRDKREVPLDTWPANVRVRSVLLSDRWMHILWQRIGVPLRIQAFTGALDLFHSPDFVLPPTGQVPAVVTVHDLSFLRVPECFVPGFRQYLARAVRRAVGRARRILADSESTKRDLIDLLNVPPDRIVVVYPGVESRFRPVSNPEVLASVRARYNLPMSFMLGLGTIQPRKNLNGLIEVFAQLVSHLESTGAMADLHLVLVGEEGWLAQPTYDAIRRTGLAHRIHLTGFVDDLDLPAVYSLARVFAFPSWYEGFGLPVLEAMACGIPTVAADNSSLPEVVGQAGLLVRTEDRAAWVVALVKVLTDEGLRQELNRKGQKRAARYTWERAGMKLLKVYHSLVKSNSSTEVRISHSR